MSKGDQVKANQPASQSASILAKILDARRNNLVPYKIDQNQTQES